MLHKSVVPLLVEGALLQLDFSFLSVSLLPCKFSVWCVCVCLSVFVDPVVTRSRREWGHSVADRGRLRIGAARRRRYIIIYSIYT